MRKAFDSNVPKLKPRLKAAPAAVGQTSAPVQEQPQPEVEASASLPEPVQEAPREPIQESSAPPATAARSQPRSTRSAPAQPRQVEQEVEAVSVVEPATDLEARRERLEKIKRKVAEAARTGARIEPIPQEPARAAESVLVLVRDLETQLSRSRDLEQALRADLTQTKGELTRTVTEGRVVADRLGQAETQLEEKRQVLEEMLGEMGALEEERDQAVRRAQALSALDEERQRLLDDLGRRSGELEQAVEEHRVEEERLSSELDTQLAENARLRAGLTEVTRERDTLAREVEQVTQERDQLLQAKSALEQVHQALSQARARLGS